MEKQFSITMPSPLPEGQVQRLASTTGAFAATIIDSPKFTDAEKRRMLTVAKEFTDFIAMYACRYDLEEPDVIWLDKSLQMMRQMLVERGLLGDANSDERGLECA